MSGTIARKGVILIVVIGQGLLAASVRGGSLDDPAAPTDAASALYTLQNIYNRFDTGAAGAKRSGPFAEPVTGPMASAITLDDIMAKAPAVSTNAALASDVLAGKMYWGLKTSAWGNKTGAMAAGAFSPGSSAVAAGYYATTNLSQVDTNLAAGNIKAGATIFGIAGSAYVVDTTGGDAAAGDILAGKKAYVAGAEVIGSIPVKTLSPASTAMAAGYYATTNLSRVDPDLTSNSILYGVTIFGVTGSPSVVDTSLGGADATAGDLVAGRVAWVGGLALTGTIATATLSPMTTAMVAGYYATTNLSQVDTNLVATKIKSGVTMFGLAGTYAGETLYATNGVSRTGQTNSYAEYDDGWYNTNRGVARPVPRFTVQSDTNLILDNLTGLMWARDANVFGSGNWTDHVPNCNNLVLGGYDDWRMPNYNELRSLLDYGFSAPALCNTTGDGQCADNDPFTNIQLATYWSSTIPIRSGSTYLDGRGYVIDISSGAFSLRDVYRSSAYVWPVRGGE